MGSLLAAFVLLAGIGLGAYGYTTDSALLFFGGLAAAALALGPVAARAHHGSGRGSALSPGVLAAAYLVLPLVGVELVWGAIESLRSAPEVLPVYDYGTARADPAGFRRWWNTRMERWFRLSPEFTQPDPRGANPYVLKPNATFTRHQSRVHINALGFSGPEIARDKAAHFRIVALGESTTFGLTLLPGDRPWPEVLEERIRAEYACAAPVQVINAGVPGWNLENQLRRLPHDVLPLQPDVLLSYHGYNGFDFFLLPLPSVRVHASPLPPPRPSRILEALEREVRLAWFRRRYREARVFDRASLQVDPLDNLYARHYRELVELGRRHGAQVVLSSFNLAVDAESPEDVIRFYEEMVPDVRARIVANRIHTQVIRAVGQREGVLVIDTSPGLDGAYRDAYIDIVHLTQTGRDRLAANLLDGLRDVLSAQPRPGCQPRSTRQGPQTS